MDGWQWTGIVRRSASHELERVPIACESLRPDRGCRSPRWLPADGSVSGWDRLVVLQGALGNRAEAHRIARTGGKGNGTFSMLRRGTGTLERRDKALLRVFEEAVTRRVGPERGAGPTRSRNHAKCRSSGPQHGRRREDQTMLDGVIVLVVLQAVIGLLTVGRFPKVLTGVLVLLVLVRLA